MILASKIPNGDPKPHRCIMCSDRFARPQLRSKTSHDTKPVPRDKFAITTVHQVNQILVNFRRTAGPEREGLPFLLTMELAAIRRGDREHFGPDARDHAEKVLTRYQQILTGSNA